MNHSLSIPRKGTLSEKVAQQLEHSILTEMSAGDRLLPEPELALKLGVSRGTIRSSLKILEENDLISRQKKRGTIVTHHTVIRTVSLVFPGSEHFFMNSEYIAPVISGITSRAGREKIDIVISCQGFKGISGTPDAIKRLPWDRTDGTIVYEEFNPAVLQSIAEFSQKLVVVDCDATSLGLTSVVFDNREAGRIAARKLIASGHTRLAFCGEMTDHGQGLDPAYGERFEGFSSEILKHGCALQADEVFDFPRSGYTPKLIDAAARRLVAGKYTGVFDITGYASLQIRERVAAWGKSAALASVGLKTISHHNPTTMDQPTVTFDGFSMGTQSIVALSNLLTGRETPGALKTIAPVFIDSHACMARS